MKHKQSYHQYNDIVFDAVTGQLELQRYYRYLTKHFKRVQFVITNTTDQAQEVRLWGANSDISLTRSSRFENQFSTTLSVGVGNYPQGIVYNPATNLFYVANQLSDSISVLNAQGELIQTIPLAVIAAPAGTYSPVTLAVNASVNSSGYGMIYVINSVRDSISVIDQNHSIIDELLTGKRPIDIAYNPVDDHFYVVSLTEATLFAINASTRQVDSRQLEGIPFSLAINTDNGHIVVNIPELDSVYLYDTDHQRLGIFDQIGLPVVDWAFHPLNGKLYGVVQQSPSLLILDTTSISQNRIPVEGTPLSIAYSEAEGLLYIGENRDGQILRLNEKNDFITPFPVADFETGIAIHPQDGTVLLSQATRNTVTIVQVQKAEVTIVENYQEYREEFRSAPIMVKHLKVVSSDQLISNLFLEDGSITGKRFTRSINISSHNSPRNFLSVAEVFDIDKTLIDGRHQWRFTMSPQTCITLLLYYKQFEINQLIK